MNLKTVFIIGISAGLAISLLILAKYSSVNNQKSTVAIQSDSGLVATAAAQAVAHAKNIINKESGSSEQEKPTTEPTVSYENQQTPSPGNGQLESEDTVLESVHQAVAHAQAASDTYTYDRPVQSSRDRNVQGIDKFFVGAGDRCSLGDTEGIGMSMTTSTIATPQQVPTEVKQELQKKVMGSPNPFGWITDPNLFQKNWICGHMPTRWNWTFPDLASQQTMPLLKVSTADFVRNA